MNEKEKNYTTELCEIISKLTKEEQLYIIGLGQGILLGRNGKK